MSTSPSATSPHEALDRLRAALAPVSSETVEWAQAVGRVLAEPVRADRDQPAHDVSAMDGYAVRLGDLGPEPLPVAGEVQTGAAPPALPEGRALRIFTGGCVPAEAEAVVRREDAVEEPDRITLRVEAAAVRPGQNIRRRGENLRAGGEAVAAGAVVTPAVGAALAGFGAVRPRVRRRLRVGVLVTGDELLDPAGEPAPWQIRDTNGPALWSLFAALPWVEWCGAARVADRPEALAEAVGARLEQCDALLLTGGVSAGDHDHVPGAIERSGCRILFHRLPIRPGKPLLGAVGPQGQAILGLPGNPVSVLVTARRFALAALRRRSGLAPTDAPVPVVRLKQDDGKRIGLWWYRPVRLAEDGVAELVATMGSGDLVSAARADGFVELPPDSGGEGPWPYRPWGPA